MAEHPPGPTMRTVLRTLNARGYEVGLDDAGARVLVRDADGHRAWLVYGRVMRFHPAGAADAAFAAALDTMVERLPNEWAPAVWCEVGVEDADLAWQLERFGVRPGAYALAVRAGVTDVLTIAAKYGLPSPSSEDRDDA